jgi:hypothetical protein
MMADDGAIVGNGDHDRVGQGARLLVTIRTVGTIKFYEKLVTSGTKTSNVKRRSD